jgi:hypothetical protein
MMDLRYHIVSLVAVFLALAAGVVMGTALAGSKKMQEGAFASLERQFLGLREQDTELKAENQRLQQRLMIWHQAGRELRGPALRNRLAGHRVGIIICGRQTMPEYWPELRATLNLSGAQVGPVILLPDAPRPVEAALRQRFSTLWSSASGPTLNDKYEAIPWLLKVLADGGNGQILEELGRASGIRFQGSLSDPVRRFLVLSAQPSPDRAQKAMAADLPEFALMEAATAARARLVFCEEEAASISLVSQLAAQGSPTVDDIETMLGQMAAVLALDGANGAFGVKPGASRPLPPVTP